MINTIKDLDEVGIIYGINLTMEGVKRFKHISSEDDKAAG